MPGQVSEALEKAKAAQEALKGNKAPEFGKLSLWVFFFFFFLAGVNECFFGLFGLK